MRLNLIHYALRFALGAVVLSCVGIPIFAQSQGAPEVKVFSGGAIAQFSSKRIPIEATKVVHLRFQGLAPDDLIVIRKGKVDELQIVGGVYYGTRGTHVRRAPGESLIPRQYAPLPDGSLEANGAQIEFKRPAALSGVVFLDVSVPEGVQVDLEVNEHSFLNASIGEPLSITGDKVGIGSRNVVETMLWVAYPDAREEVKPLATPGEYAVAFHRLRVRKRVEPQIATNGRLLALLAIDESGRVVRAVAYTGEGRRDLQAEERLQQWEFEPFIVNGQPVRVVTTLTIR
jgi:hypothetical protein